MDKRQKIALGMWVFNLSVFLISLFTYHYMDNLGHWSTNAWLSILWGSGIFKIIITAINMILLFHKDPDSVFQ